MSGDGEMGLLLESNLFIVLLLGGEIYNSSICRIQPVSIDGRFDITNYILLINGQIYKYRTLKRKKNDYEPIFIDMKIKFYRFYNNFLFFNNIDRHKKKNQN